MSENPRETPEYKRAVQTLAQLYLHGCPVEKGIDKLAALSTVPPWDTRFDVYSLSDQLFEESGKCV